MVVVVVLFGTEKWEEKTAKNWVRRQFSWVSHRFSAAKSQQIADWDDLYDFWVFPPVCHGRVIEKEPLK